MLALMAFVVALSGCRSLRLSNATIQSEDDWLTEGGDSRRSYARDVSLQPPLEIAWEYNAGGAFGPGSPLILNGSVVVGTRKGEVHAIDLETGRSRGVMGVGESVDGTPVIGSTGILYVPVSWGRRGLYAYDLARGSSLWRQKRVPVEAGLLLLEDRLIAADVESNVVAYHPRSGEVIWERTLSDRAVVHASPVQSGPDEVVVADDDGMVIALRAGDGAVLWERPLGMPIYATPTVSDGIVYVPTTRGILAALDAQTGDELFRFDLAHPEVKVSTPAVHEDLLVVGGSDGSVRAIHRKSGEQIWTFDGEEAIGGAPVIAGGFVFTADMSRMVRAHDLHTGDVVWEMELNGRIKSAMAVANEGLVVLAEPRNVILLKPTEAHAASR